MNSKRAACIKETLSCIMICSKLSWYEVWVTSTVQNSMKKVCCHFRQSILKFSLTVVSRRKYQAVCCFLCFLSLSLLAYIYEGAVPCVDCKQRVLVLSARAAAEAISHFFWQCIDIVLWNSPRSLLGGFVGVRLEYFGSSLVIRVVHSWQWQHRGLMI